MARPTYFTSNFGTKINVTGLSGRPLARVQSLANQKYGTKAQALARSARMRIPKVVTPVDPKPAAPTTPATTQQASQQEPSNPIQPLNTTAQATATPPTTPQTASPGTVETLFPSTRMFEPKNYEGSPLYKFQVQQGEKQLAKSLAARGLTNSGHGIEEELNIPLRAAAQDTDRMTRVASENADRLKSFQDNEALRLERAGNNQWDRAYSLAALMAQQSPWSAALAGLNNTADITNKMGQDQANFLKDYYQRVMGGGGGGGGGGSSGGTPIPLPSGPNFSNITPTEIGGNYSSNSGWLNLLTKGLSSFF